MDLSTIYTKTGRGARAQIKKLPPNAGQILSAMGAKASGADIFDKLKKVSSVEFNIAITWLLEGGFIKEVPQEAFSDSVWAPIGQGAIAVSEISFDEFEQTTPPAAPETAATKDTPPNTELAPTTKVETTAETAVEPFENIVNSADDIAEESTNKPTPETKPALPAEEAVNKKAKIDALNKADEEARERAEAQLIALNTEKERAEIEANLKAEAELAVKQQADEEARLLAEAQAKAEAQEKAEKEAQAGRERAALEAQAKQEAREKLEAEQKAEAEALALQQAQLQAQQQAVEEARMLAEAQAKAEAEEKAEKEAQARAELEAQAKIEAKKQAELAAQAELEALANAQEQARANAEAEAEAQKKAELEAKALAKAQAKAEAEAKKKADAEAKAEAKALARAELLAKTKAREQERLETLAREQAEKEAQAQAELEAKILAEEEAKAQKQAAERTEAVAKLEAEAREKAEQDAKLKAEATAKKKALKTIKAQAKAQANAQRKLAFAAKISQFKAQFGARLSSFGQVLAFKKSRTEQPKLETAELEQTDAAAENKRAKKQAPAALGFAAKLIKNVLLCGFLLIVISTVALQFINISPLIQPAERIVQANTGEYANIQAVHIAVYPKPHLQLEGLSLGNLGEIKTKNVGVFANPKTLLGLLNVPSGAMTGQSPQAIDAIKIEGLEIAQQDLTRPKAWLKAGHQLNQLKIKQIVLQKANLHLNELAPIVVDGEILVNEQGEASQAVFSADEKHLTITFNDTDKGYALEIKGEQWRLPVPPNLVFSELNAKGSIENNTLTLSAIHGVLYDGQLNAQLNSQLATQLGSNMASSGDLKLSNIDLAKMADDLKADMALDGDFSGNANYTFSYNLNKNQVDSPMLNGRFEAKNGHLKKIDLNQVLHNNPNIGGSTAFNLFTGNVNINNQSYQYNNLALQDKQLVANGAVNIASDGRLTGDIDSRIALKSSQIASRISITGNAHSIKRNK